MRCSACQHENEPHAATCSGCGADLGSPAASALDRGAAAVAAPTVSPAVAPSLSVVTLADAGRSWVPSSVSVPGSGGRGSSGSDAGVTIADAKRPAGSGLSGLGGGSGYTVVRPIGVGGMGRVDLAWDARLNRWVALKRLAAQFDGDPRLQIRFQVEAQAVAALNHFHIVQVYAFSEDESGPYLALEYVPGPARSKADPSWGTELPAAPMTLEQWVQDRGPLSANEVAVLGEKLCSALGYAHKRGVIHRDVKPANVLLTEEREPKLTDFGLARRVDRQGEGVTLAGAQLLTLGYGAPEQETDASRVDQRADIYGLGGTLWYALTGQSPRFFRESDVPQPLRPVLTKALAKDREQRYGSAEELGAALQAVGAGAPAGATAVGADEPVPPGCWRCDKCRRVNRETVRYCEGCGTDSCVLCPKCQQPTRASAKHCGACGVDVPAYGQAQAALREARALLDERRWREAVAKAEDGLRTKQLESELHAIRNEAAARAEEADATRAELQQLLGRRAYGEAHACLDRLRGLSCTTGAGATEWAEFERALSARVVGEVLSMAEGVLAKGEWSAVSQHARTVQSFERGNARAQELVVEAQFGSQSMQLDALLVCGRFEEARSLLASLQQLVTGAPGSEAKQAALTQAAKRAVRDACIRADGAFAQGAWTDAVEWARSALLFEPDDLRARELAISARQRLRAVHWRMASIASCSVAVLGFAIWALTTPDEHHGTTAGLCLAGACFLWLWAVLFVGVRRAVGAAPDGQPRESPRARTEASLAPAIASSAQHATAQSVSLPVTQVIDLGGVSLTLILIPAGTFQMGSPMEDLERFENEGPQHEVTISRPFYAGITEVTGEQWQAVMGNKPSQFKGDAGLPVERVSWDDCREFCRRLTAQLAYVQTPAHGFLVRLPSEAEWEYACRAGSRAGLSLSDNSSQLGDYAWRAGNSSSSTHPVGAKTPNAWGLYDMHGNVWEWCEDEYHGRYDGAPTDGSAWITGGDSRVRRGGSWISEARYCRSAARDGEAQSCRRHNLGLRVVAVPDWEARSA